MGKNRTIWSKIRQIIVNRTESKHKIEIEVRKQCLNLMTLKVELEFWYLLFMTAFTTDIQKSLTRTTIFRQLCYGFLSYN